MRTKNEQKEAEKQRHEIYKKVLAAHKSFHPDFSIKYAGGLCLELLFINYKKDRVWYSSMEAVEQFPELDIFNPGTYMWFNNEDENGRFVSYEYENECRDTVLMFCIEMTR